MCWATFILSAPVFTLAPTSFDFPCLELWSSNITASSLFGGVVGLRGIVVLAVIKAVYDGLEFLQRLL